MNIKFLVIVLLFPILSSAQSTLESAIKAGEFIMAGYSIFKVAKSDPKKESKTIESVCIKNRLSDKFTYSIVGETFEGEKIKKELVVQVDSKECFLELPKGIYTYEVVLANKEIYKKGDYKFEDDIIITFRKD